MKHQLTAPEKLVYGGLLFEASCLTYGGIGSLIVNGVRAEQHSYQYEQKVQPLKGKLAAFQAQEATPENQTDRIQLRLAHAEQHTRQQIHKAQASIRPNPSAADVWHDTKNYAGYIGEGVIGFGALCALLVMGSRAAASVKHRIGARQA